MKIKKVLAPILLSAVLILQSGCAIFHSDGKNSRQEETARTRVENVETLIDKNVTATLDELANISYGVDYALSKEQQPSNPVQVARDLNTRAMALSGAPSLEEVKSMKTMIDDLTSQLKSERAKGQKLLEEKDLQITTLQTQTELLQEAKDAEIDKYMKLAQETAARADEIQSQLDKMNDFFGLGAVFYGLKRFFTRIAWLLGIGSILYIVLRFASMSNPFASAIFSLFDQIMSWFVHLIKVLAPRALEVAGQTATSVANSYKNAMSKMVKNIKVLKERQEAAGLENKKYTLDELLVEFSKSMNDDEKKMVDEIKRNVS